MVDAQRGQLRLDYRASGIERECNSADTVDSGQWVSDAV